MTPILIENLTATISAFFPKMDHKTPVATTRCAENASQNDNGDNVCRNVTSNRWWHIFSHLNELPSSVD